MNCYEKALSYLALREHTEKELKNKLALKGYTSEEISTAVERLLAEGSLSDSRFAECYIRSRMRKNPEGKSLLCMRLMQKGLSSTLSREAVDRYFSENEETVQAQLLSCYQRLAEKKGNEKAVQTLLQKGFSRRDLQNLSAE